MTYFLIIIGCLFFIFGVGFLIYSIRSNIDIDKKQKKILVFWSYEPPKKISFSQLPKTEQEYFKTRVDDQIDWYDKKSIISQKKYKILTFMTIFCSCLSPILVNLIPTSIVSKILISILGFAMTLFQGTIGLNKYNEQWISYRTTCETLKKERNMYITNSGIYAEKQDFHSFVERIESLISNENINWASLNNPDDQERS